MMQKNHVAPDSVTMNTLVDAASLSGNLEIAEDVRVLKDDAFIGMLQYLL